MLYSVPNVAALPKPVDDWMGEGYYQTWLESVRDVNKQFKALDYNSRMLPNNWAPRLLSQVDSDAWLLAKIASDHAWGLEQLSQGRRISKDQLNDLSGLQGELYDVVESGVGCIMAVVASGLLSAFVLGQFNNVQNAATTADQKIAALKVALNSAKNKRLQSVGQGAADTALFVAGLAFPELAVLAKITIAVGQMYDDDLMGGSKGSATLDTASDVTSRTAIVTAAADARWIGARLGKVGSKAGTVVGVAGLALDGAEISKQFKNVDDVSRALNEAVASLSTLRRLLERLSPGLVSLRAHWNAVARNLKNELDVSNNVRSDVMDAIRELKYDTTRPTVWRLEP